MNASSFPGKASFVLKLRRDNLPPSRVSGSIFVDGVINGKEYNCHFFDNLKVAPSRNGKDYGEYLIAKKLMDGGYEIKTDPIGYYTLYYSVFNSWNESFLLLSNDFLSLREALPRISGSGKLDYDAWYPILASQHNVFSNNFSDHTSDSRIKLLQPFHSIIYKNGTVSLSRQNDLCHFDDYSSYLFFLEKGVQQVCENLYSTVSNNGSDTELYLSGGKDSRVCLALALKSLGKESFSCQTSIPKFGENRPGVEKDVLSDDYKISCYIAEKENLKLNKNLPLVKYYLNNNFYHQLMESWKSNAYFQGYSANASISVNLSQVNQIWGGSGEMLRATKYFSSLSKKATFGNSKVSVEDDACLMFDTIVNPSRAPSQHGRSKEFFVSKFLQLDGATIQQKLDSLFMLNRNVFHSGKHRQKLSQKTNIFLPFADINFLKASRCLPYKNHELRILHGDIIKLSRQNLSDYPYTGDSEVDGLFPEREISKLIAGDTKRKEKAEKLNLRDNHEQPFYDYAIEYVDNALEKVSDELDVSDKLISYIKNKMRRKDRVSLTVLSKVSSVVPPFGRSEFPVVRHYEL
ncbi:hypothetical protein IOC61_00275 [Halomonas sp. KAO]|uniref:hypothetical protein n=1 Tax=Halomonas sp. KAO TaxID=2783858 RepID=UPI00189C909E|nr:hypothetical protein [Halomonas sp. KAO]MBF7051765.1 hypothetical protein [Halomonas sp. KAO]